MMKRFHPISRVLAACVVFLLGAVLRAENVLIVGEALGKSAEFAARLRAAGIEPQAASAAELARLDAACESLVIVASEETLPSDSRRHISRFLELGGHAIVVGPRAFDYAPEPVRGVALGRFDDPRSYRMEYPERKRVSRTASVAEPERKEMVPGPDGRPALSFRTYLRGMKDFLVRLDATSARSPERSVLRFWARGDAYMDLIAIEILDTNNRRWFGFVPLGAEWAQHAISLADFIPEGWTDANEPYPLLAPESVASVALGTNMLALWTEKPMTLAIGTVELAENARSLYAPTSAVRYARLPFRENDLTTPSWLFDPFAGAERIEAVHGLRPTEHFPVAAPAALPGAVTTWRCRPPYLEHPGTRMGTDHSKDYILKFERERRHIGFWGAIDGEGQSLGAVVELQVAAAGRMKGANIGTFGVAVRDLLRSPVLLGSLADMAAYVVGRPKVAGVTINTTDVRKGAPARPAVIVTVQNPRGEPAEGRLIVKVGDGRVQGEAEVAIGARGTATQTVTLSTVPEDFPFEAFDWEVSLETNAGTDTMHDRVDVERGLIHALTHMVKIQREFPDGRFGHHYFGDAYGVRAMFAYLDLLERQPGRRACHPDLWRQVSPAEIRSAGLRFFDMMVARQNEDGSIPMGYAEHHNVFNVADGGQISISYGQILPLLGDSAREAAYLQFCRRFVDWAETFYIDEALSAKLKETHPREAAKGEANAGLYGLGWGHLTRNQTGPAWVLADILGVQALMTYVDSNPEYKRIFERNIRAYLDGGYSATGYFWAEGLVWSWLTTEDDAVRARIAENLRETFLADVSVGQPNDMFDRGARETLNGLPLLYYRRFFEDNATVRAVLMKYAWAFASENADLGMRRVAAAAPKPHHGESIAAAKFAAFSAIWAVELLDPGASLLKVKGFPRVSVDVGRSQ
jgi:hypothetical protein